MDKIEVSSFQVGENLSVDRVKRQVLKNNKEILLPELSYRLLLCLVQSAPEVVSQQVLLEQVWQGKIVSDDTIKKRVSRLREAIGLGETFIIAERGIGYRLGVSVTSSTTCSAQTQVQKSQKQNKSIQWLLPSIVLAAAVLLILINNYFVTDVDLAHDTMVNLESANHFDVSMYMGLTDEKSLLTGVDKLQQQLDKTPKDIAILSTLSTIYLTRYQLHQPSVETLERALSYAETAVKFHAKQPWAHVVLAQAKLNQGKLTESIKHADIAISLASSWVDGYVIKANALRELGHINEAWQTITIAHDSQPENTKVQFEFAKVLRLKNMFSRSERILKTLLVKDELKVFSQLALAELYIATSRYEEADTLLNTLLSSFPNAAQAKFYQAVLNDVQGKQEQALSLYNEVASTGLAEAAVSASIITLHSTINHNKVFQQSNETSLSQFTQGLSIFSKEGESAFIDALNKAISAGFATEYLLNSSILNGAIKQTTTKKKLQLIQQQLYHLNQNKRIKRVPVISN
ncbi:winged helix-turn-helix domain-containing protein [Thalassotalea marina]|uniref:OmpR/PhoB-type domain-containing protein n=1 Tax=Thalassotalea marina TaxID=1673741 RepID=A0A919BQW7_9GAMM|nr:winged helix-turn-helix domain-containing protein [Thalassotalea marina]GHG06083.1 hypothetical protein GCM10017161_39620 [Thalassotalea marina]